MNKKKIFKNAIILSISSVAIATIALLSVPLADPNTYIISQTTTPHSVTTTNNVSTSITVRSDLPRSTEVHKLMAIINPNGRVNQIELLKYININGLAPRTTITLKQTSINYASGQISFILTLDKYYDAKLELITEDFISTPLILNLAPRPNVTNIYTKIDYPTDIRVDDLIATFAESSNGGLITNLDNLEKYVNIQGIPPETNISINAQPQIEYLTGEIAFAITMDKFYGVDYELNSSEFNSPQIVLSGFIPRFEATTVTAKGIADYDQTLKVDLFKQKLYVNGKLDVNFLKQYVDIKSQPTRARITILFNKIDNKSGIVDFNVQLSHYHNDSNNLINSPKTFPIVLQLTPKIYQTTVTLLPSYPKTITPVLFETLVGTGTNVNQISLLKYINLNNTPEEAIVSSVTHNAAETGMISLTIELDQYFDENLELKNNGTFDIQIPYQDYNLETIIQPLSNFQNDEVVTNLLDKINPYDLISGIREVNQNELSKYVDLSTLPPEADLYIDLNDSTQYYLDENNGDVGFKIQTSQVYNNKNVLVNTPTIFSINLKLLPSRSNTIIRINNSYKSNISMDDFINYITIDNQIQYNRLGEYLDLSLVPTTAVFNLQNIKQDDKGSITFNVVSNKWYNNNHVTDGEYIEHGIKLDLALNVPSLNWLWITLGSVAGVILLIGLIFWIQKKRDKKNFLF